MADRRARYVCVIVAIGPEGEEITVEGTLEGTIATRPPRRGGVRLRPGLRARGRGADRRRARQRLEDGPFAPSPGRRSAGCGILAALIPAPSRADHSGMPDPRLLDDLRREALDAARGLFEGEQALVAALAGISEERSRAAEAYGAVVRSLAVALSARDGYTGEHSDTVRELSVAVGAGDRARTARRSPRSRPARCSTTSARSASRTRSCTSRARSTPPSGR